MKECEEFIKGYIRKLEMTYYKERNDYNPHFHVIGSKQILFYNKRYYIAQKEWLSMWREATDLPEITQVHIQKVELIREGKAVAEVAKYSAKDYEMASSQEVFDVFYEGLKGRQLIVYGGLCKEYAKNMKMVNWTSIKQKISMNIIINY